MQGSEGMCWSVGGVQYCKWLCVSREGRKSGQAVAGRGGGRSCWLYNWKSFRQLYSLTLEGCGLVTNWCVGMRWQVKSELRVGVPIYIGPFKRSLHNRDALWRRFSNSVMSLDISLETFPLCAESLVRAEHGSTFGLCINQFENHSVSRAKLLCFILPPSYVYSCCYLWAERSVRFPSPVDGSALLEQSHLLIGSRPEAMRFLGPDSQPDALLMGDWLGTQLHKDYVASRHWDTAILSERLN